MADNSYTEENKSGDSLSPSEETALVEACISGDPAAWRRLVDIYGPRVYAAIRFFLRAFRESMHKDDSLNIYQEMFLDLCSNNFRKLKTFLGGGKLAPWLYIVARRQCLNYVRASTRKKRLRPTIAGPELLDLGTPLSDRDDPFKSVDNREAVFSALERLDSKSRLLLILFYYEGLSYEEIAITIGVSEHSISPIMRKAREDIAKILGE